SAAEGAEKAVGARDAGADAEELAGNAERAAEEVGVYAEEAGEALQGGHLARERSVIERELILLRLIPFRDGFLTREVISEFAEAGGVVGARQAVRGGLRERVEGAGDPALRLCGDSGLLRGREAGIVQDALELRVEQIAG